MIPTFFTTLAVGTITNVVASIIALSAWITGSVIYQGNVFFDTTNNTTPAIYVNTTKVADVTISGATLYSDGLVREAETFAKCTATGGLTSYSTCWLPSPMSTSGSLLGVSLECGNVAAQLTGDVSFKLTSTSGSGTPLTSLDNIVAGTGSLEVSDFATEVAWNPEEGLAYSTLVTPGATADCRLYATYSDKYGD